MRKTVEEYDPNAGWTPAADTAYVRAPVAAADGLGRYGVLVARAGSYGFMLLLEIDLRDPNDPNDDFIPWKYTWGLDLAGQNGQVNSLESAGTIGGLLAMQDMDDPNDPSDPNDATGRFACFYDGNGNLTQLLHLGTWDPNNPEVAIRAHYEYDPYGNIVRQTGSYAATNPWRFSTKQFDDETGLGYWGYRYYSPTLGRWISRDPLTELASFNLYRSLENSPLQFIDTLGQDTLTTQPASNRPESGPTTQPAATDPNAGKACCRYHEHWGYRSYRERNWQITRDCGDTDPEKCCSSCCWKGPRGLDAYVRYLRSATRGPCCSCRIERRRRAGDPWNHTAIFVKCENGALLFMDHAGPNGQPAKSHVEDFGRMKDWAPESKVREAWSRRYADYPVLQDSHCMSCDDLGELVNFAKSFDGWTYGLIQDCYWFGRWMMSHSRTLTESRDSCPEMP